MSGICVIIEYRENSNQGSVYWRDWMKEELTSREKRRRRRIRNQIIAYVVSGCFLTLIAVGGIFGVRAAMNGVTAYNDKVSNALAEAENMSQEVQTEDATVVDESQEVALTQQPENDALDELVNALLQEMTLEEKVAGMFLVTPESITGVSKVIQAGEGTKTALTENPVGGILYTEKNFKSEEQFLEMLSNTRAYAKYPLFLAVQRECGDVSTFGIAATQKATEFSSSDDVATVYTSIAEALAGYGINMNLAPVADVVSQEGNVDLQGRTFGSDATAAAPLVDAAVQALQEKEISAVLTKFPGEGSVDTGKGFTITKSLEELKNSEFLTYERAIKNGVDCIMVSNVSAPEVTGDETPCSMSSVIIQDTLRNTLGFQGIVMTDMLNAEVVTSKYSDSEAAVSAILAGADVLLAPADYYKAYEGVIQAVENGTITEERIQESLVRIYRVKYKHALDQ